MTTGTIYTSSPADKGKAPGPNKPGVREDSMKRYKGYLFDEANGIVYEADGKEVAFKHSNYNRCIHFINTFGEGKTKLPYKVDLEQLMHHDPAYLRKVAELLKKDMPVVYKAWIERCDYLGDVYEPLEAFARERYPDEYAKACASIPYTYEDAKQYLDTEFDKSLTDEGKQALIMSAMGAEEKALIEKEKELFED